MSADRLKDELDRLGVSFRKAGAAGYISVQLGIRRGEAPRPATRASSPLMARPEWHALELLAELPDDAGATDVWRALNRR